MDRDYYDAPSPDYSPDRILSSNNYLLEQNVAMQQTISVILSEHPEISRSITRHQRETAKTIYSLPDAAGTLHWTFTNPHAMGS